MPDPPLSALQENSPAFLVAEAEAYSSKYDTNLAPIFQARWRSSDFVAGLCAALPR